MTLFSAATRPKNENYSYDADQSVLKEEANISVVAENKIPEKAQENLDHLIRKDGVVYAGSHVLLDFWDASRLDDISYMEEAFKAAVEAAGATLLSMNFHHFTPNNGISGVAILAESHISVHTWPEYGYAAFDIFMCGGAEPLKGADVLKQYFAPKRCHISDCKRGIFGDDE